MKSNYCSYHSYYRFDYRSTLVTLLLLLLLFSLLLGTTYAYYYNDDIIIDKKYTTSNNVIISLPIISTEATRHNNFQYQHRTTDDDDIDDNNNDFLLPFDKQVNTPPIEYAHGTTTLSFTFQGGIIVAVDSRASLGNFIGSKTTQKVLPINTHILSTMAGGAADCTYWIRKLRCEASLIELKEGNRITVDHASRYLSNILYQLRRKYGNGNISMGTMVMGYDDNENDEEESSPKIYYIDDSGIRIEGDIFAVGSGSTLALGILDIERKYDMSIDEAIALGIKAIRYATFRDSYSGGYINIYLITPKNGWKRVFTEDLDTTSQRIIATNGNN